MSSTDGSMVIGRDGGGGIVELYSFSKMPKADKASLEKLLGQREQTSDVKVAVVNGRHRQNGSKGISFSGTATVRGTPVVFRAVALGVGSRVAISLGISLVDLDAAAQKQLWAIVASQRKAR